MTKRMDKTQEDFAVTTSKRTLRLWLVTGIAGLLLAPAAFTGMMGIGFFLAEYFYGNYSNVPALLRVSGAVFGALIMGAWILLSIFCIAQSEDEKGDDKDE